MKPEELIIEAHVDGVWEDAARLVLLEPSKGCQGRTRLTYTDAHLSRHIDHLGEQGSYTLGERYGLDFEVWSLENWPAFLLDMVPMGAARRFWARALERTWCTERELDSLLLCHHTTGPIGHLRIASPEQSAREPLAFSRQEVCRWGAELLGHAAASGARLGGAAGAGGDAPKVLLVEDIEGNLYLDGALPDEDVQTSWLVKWPRGEDTERDRLILRAEYLFSRALGELGLDVCRGHWHHLRGCAPSLWLERFDRRSSPGSVQRAPVESLYSLAGVARPGAVLAHEHFLESLRDALARRDQLEDLPELARELVCRDLLDVVLGNTDNHGRNRAVLRGDRLVWAPIYDLAPMVMDPDGIARSTHWRDHEHAGRIDYVSVCRTLDRWLGESGTLEVLREFAHRLLDLPELLRELGLDEEVSSFPRIDLEQLPMLMKRWSLV